MTPKLKKIIILIIVLAILFVVYAVFIKADPVNTALIDGRATGKKSVGQEDARALGTQISQALLRIEQISLDKTIFNDAVYISLKDRSQPITDEPIGRDNPFAPIGQVSVNSSTRSSTSTAPSTSSTTPKATSTPATTSNPPAASASGSSPASASN